jgi:hypothetical protein
MLDRMDRHAFRDPVTVTVRGENQTSARCEAERSIQPPAEGGSQRFGYSAGVLAGGRR